MNRRNTNRFPNIRPLSEISPSLSPFNEKVENVLDIIENTAGKLLVDTDLFDIYENEERKSLAFHLIFPVAEKTLTDEEVNGVMEKIFTAIEANDDWEVRR